MPRQIPYRVTVSFGRPMPPTSTAVEVRSAVQELQATAFETRKVSMKTLDQAFVRTARQRPWRFFMADGKTTRVSFGSALNKTIYIARRLRRHIGEQPMVGVLLPPSVGGALTNYALMLMGRVPVNLNYTSSNETIASCAEQCGLDLVITSKAFIERFPNMTIPGRILLLEDVLSGPRFSEKLSALAMAWLMPAALLKRLLGAGRARPISEAVVAARTGNASPMDNLATVIFSSGSTGDPKGVMLSHFNIVSNIKQVTQVFMLDGRNRILGILPFFHSFGFTAGLWLPAVQGVGVVFHPNPPRCASDRRAGGKVQGDVSGRDANIFASLHAALHAGAVWLPSVCAGWSGKASGTHSTRAIAFESQ
jgi:acyl-[acyl-carrier-protein]-phospholipid O-acyltransferase/long-chain-fatty-acid--[acyl-carrier-protein] ligase